MLVDQCFVPWTQSVEGPRSVLDVLAVFNRDGRAALASSSAAARAAGGISPFSPALVPRDLSTQKNPFSYAAHSVTPADLFARSQTAFSMSSLDERQPTSAAWGLSEASALPTPSSSAYPFGSLDQDLESPLGLASFSGSPMFAEDDELPALDFDQETDAPLFAVSAADLSSTFAPSQGTATALTAPSSSTSTPAPSHALPTRHSPRPKRSRPVPTGFRGSGTTLLPLDAPVQPRSYPTPSATSRRDKAADLDKKRWQNTISARKSRARKQERLDQLEEENEALKEECERLRELVRALGGKP